MAPRIPMDLVIESPIRVDYFGLDDALGLNLQAAIPRTHSRCAMTKPTPAEGGHTFDLEALDQELRSAPAYLRDGHTARTLVREPDLRIVLVAMKAGARLPEHRADETASVHVLRGHVRLRLPAQLVDLPSGRLLVLERALPHDLEALQESALLLTLGWKPP